MKNKISILVVLAIGACGAAYWIFYDPEVFEKDLQLSYTDRQVIPSYARTKDGNPFTGIAYGTYFGDRYFDSVEWKGRFEAGKPEGSFIFYTFSGTEDKKILYENGIPIQRTKILQR